MDLKRVLTTSAFARRLGFKTAREKGFWKGLNYLSRVRAIEIQQGGFRADSMHHPKLVVVKDAEAVLRYFKILSIQVTSGTLPLDMRSRLKTTLLHSKTPTPTPDTMLEKKVQLLEKRVKQIMTVLEMAPVVSPWEWAMFSEKARPILKVLVKAGREGLTTTTIAKTLGLENPEGSGRVAVYKALKRVAKKSERLKGLPVVLSDGRRWSMNFDDYQFAKLEDEKHS